MIATAHHEKASSGTRRDLQIQPELPRDGIFRRAAPDPMEACFAIGPADCVLHRQPLRLPVLWREQAHFPVAGIAEAGRMTRGVPHLHAPAASLPRTEGPTCISHPKRLTVGNLAA